VPLEIRGILDLIREVYSELGMDEIEMFLATRPPDRAGSDAMWDQAEAALEQALRSGGYAYKVNPGDGAFYGPKIDFRIKDAIGRGHQTATCQLDFGIAEKFGLEYTAEDGSRKRPVVIHRAIYGSIERFFAILIEHFAGAFPLWLSPEQAVIVPVSEERHAGAATAALTALRAADLRASVDWSNEKLGKKIRNVSLRKVPYVLVIGDREAEAGQAAVRLRDGTDLGAIAVADIVEALRSEAASRSLTPKLGKAS
jgi:threonyl-tRNA synthetase